ncbi:MAG: glycosyltransferase [Desulfurivibrionaceae bacterium]|jgi:cellulose synthase/poly-beta-1,6-N-acetylglucosamine synthase-like glycosyltransferase/peptidoglycan/xylan/chitin deacetylase (PgdA/CDA1 family)/spore germination protein YaaH
MKITDNPRQVKRPSPAANTDSFIFLDARGKRWPRLRLFLFVAGLLLFVGMILFAQTLLLPSQLTLPPAVQQLKSRLKSLQTKEHQAGQLATRPLWRNFAKGNSSGAATFPFMMDQSGVVSSFKKTPGPGLAYVQEIRLGFYESWDPGSFDSLKANADKLTHLCPDWLTIEDGRGNIKAVTEQKVLALVKDRGLVVLPLLRNMGGEGAWLPEAVEGLVNGPAARQDQFVANLKGHLKAMGAGGVVIDWEQVDPSYRGAMTALLHRIALALHAEGMELWLCVPMGRELKVLDLDTLAEHVDHFVAMLHDENSESDPPGPIASAEWFNGWLETIIEYGESSQWVLALGSYGYDWTEGEKEAETVRFQDVMSRAGRSSLSSCDFDAPTYNPHFVYEDSGAPHTLWFLDAVTFLNQLKAGRAQHVGGVAISRLGTEDPGIWQALKLDTTKSLTRANLATLETIRPGAAIAHIGRGNFITMADERGDGARRLMLDRNADPEPQMIARYEKFPSYLTIVHQGRGAKDSVVITFDDGPDPKWTPKILDILKDKGVSATFFMVGANMEKYPDLVRRIVREGHTVGSHTYTHPNIALVSEERAYLEFNATQRLIEAITNHSTILFRPPYNADTNPHDPEELVPIKLAQKLGYITVTEDIDPEDWAQPGVAAMVENVKRGRQQGGNIVLLHDAGGDRRQTIEALPKIIDYLQARGDNIISLSAMLGIPLAQLMPPVPQNQRSMNRVVSESGFKAIHAVAEFFWAFMIVATALVVARTLSVAWLAIRSRRAGEAGLPAPDAWPPVSILIAAYNEEKVIAQTLRALLDSTYPGEIEVVVVDDGSGDTTAEIVAGMAHSEGRLHLLRQINLGKAMALKTGFDAVRHEIVVSLDADTQFAPDTIAELVRPFADPAVAAVSGRARVGNPKTLVARFQSLEYTCGFNLDRRAYHLLNCITVVPGAVSAFKKSAVFAAGGISTDTLAEDTDLTLSLHKRGLRICYAPRAVAWTEAPETIRAFAKQRFRWAFGTLQCLWKHREMLFDVKYRALGWFSLPSAWFFNILLVALGPIIDAILLFSLLMSPANNILYFYFLVFLGADLLLAAVACLIEREPLSQIWLVLPMRFIYRPVLSYAVLQAIVKASKGVLVGWGKLDRTASVTYKV